MTRHTVAKVAIHLAVHNGAHWLPAVLHSVENQTFTDWEVTLWDNASTDTTSAIASRYPKVHIRRHSANTSFWTAQEAMLVDCSAEYVIALTDVVLDSEFIAQAVAALDANPNAGSVQGKVMAMHWADGVPVKEHAIDAVGFRLQHSRRVTILGHGEDDHGQYDGAPRVIFGTEGAAAVFRRSALEDCRIHGHVIDPDYRVGAIGYGDDFDLAWRMTLLGHPALLVPAARAWHDRSTTKNTGGSISASIKRRRMRAGIAIEKRRLEWSNVRFTIIKNDAIINILRDLPSILWRELMVTGYALLFEPLVLLEWGRLVRYLPRMLRRRRAIMHRAQLTPAHIHALIQ